MNGPTDRQLSAAVDALVKLGARADVIGSRFQYAAELPPAATFTGSRFTFTVGEDSRGRRGAHVTHEHGRPVVSCAIFGTINGKDVESYGATIGVNRWSKGEETEPHFVGYVPAWEGWTDAARRTAGEVLARWLADGGWTPDRLTAEGTMVAKCDAVRRLAYDISRAADPYKARRVIETGEPYR